MKMSRIAPSYKVKSKRVGLKRLALMVLAANLVACSDDPDVSKKITSTDYDNLMKDVEVKKALDCYDQKEIDAMEDARSDCKEPDTFDDQRRNYESQNNKGNSDNGSSLANDVMNFMLMNKAMNVAGDMVKDASEAKRYNQYRKEKDEHVGGYGAYGAYGAGGYTNGSVNGNPRGTINNGNANRSGISTSTSTLTPEAKKKSGYSNFNSKSISKKADSSVSKNYNTKTVKKSAPVKSATKTVKRSGFGSFFSKSTSRSSFGGGGGRSFGG